MKVQPTDRHYRSVIAPEDGQAKGWQCLLWAGDSL